MIVKDLLDMLVNQAKKHREDTVDSINRDRHMNTLGGTCDLSQEEVDAVLVSFINYVALCQGVDLALYTIDLTKPTTTQS